MRYGFPLVLLAFALAPFPLRAASPEAVTSYAQCTELAKRDPALALDRALVWRNAGGGTAAVHCSALALVELKRYAEAARKLDALANDKTITDASDRAALFDQAGNAWLLAGLTNEAVRSFSAALALTPNDVEMLTGRARARALRKDWAGAEADLTAALAKDRNRADLLVLRASARHAQGRKVDADADIGRALALLPDYPDALVERGEMKYQDGDRQGARADWQKAAAGSGEAAAAAKRYLAETDAESKPVK